MQIRKIVLSLALALFTVTPAFAQELPPTTSPTIVGTTDKGIAMVPGWNYFKVAAESCTVKNVFNELQADGGGALVADELWKMENGKWKMLGLNDPTVDTTTVDASTTFAFNSDRKFFFDIASDACTKEDLAREDQIEAARDASVGEKEGNFLEKIAGVPGEFWSNLITTLGFKKTENALPAPKYEADSALFQKLNVLGESTVTDLGVTGKLTVGTVWIDGLEGALNALGTLKLQDKVGGPIQFLGGLVSIDTNGNLKADGKLVLPKSTGQASIKAGETQATVQSSMTTKDSKIFTSPLSDPGSPLYIKSKTNGSFSVGLRFAPESDLVFDWWIIN
ncbi:MAG: hypothetical protein Q7S60_03830 [bacterium]|nr:hypothetical protein [bacterium]